MEVVKALVELGADVHARTQAGCTALHGAAEAGHVEAVKALVQRGADLDALEHRGNSALALATVNGHNHVAQWRSPPTPPPAQRSEPQRIRSRPTRPRPLRSFATARRERARNAG